MSVSLESKPSANPTHPSIPVTSQSESKTEPSTATGDALDNNVSNESSTEDASLTTDFFNALKGFCMGVCDAVPGVSGGTVALIVGIYERLFTSISHIDRRLVSLIRQGQWREAARHIDARFLTALVLGLGIGYVVMSLAIKILMADDTLRALTLASFAGMVIGSSVIVFNRIQPATKQKILCTVCWVIGCSLSALIAFQNTAAATGYVSHWYLFLCTVVAICAMILPGISGAMLLLIFGVYYYVLEIPRNLIHLEDVGSNLLALSVVLSGCVFGLLTFGRIVRYLLHQFRAPTLSTMLGLMSGSLVVLWPFQHRIEPVLEHRKPTYENYLPAEFSGLILAVIGTVAFFAAAVFVADLLASRIEARKLSAIRSSASSSPEDV